MLELPFAGETIGHLIFQTRTEGGLTADERRLLSGLTRQVAVAARAVCSPRRCGPRASGWSRPARRSAGGCAATCTTGWAHAGRDRAAARHGPPRLAAGQPSADRCWRCAATRGRGGRHPPPRLRAAPAGAGRAGAGRGGPRAGRPARPVPRSTCRTVPPCCPRRSRWRRTGSPWRPLTNAARHADAGAARLGHARGTARWS